MDRELSVVTSPHGLTVKCNATSQKSPLMRKFRNALPMEGGSGIFHDEPEVVASFHDGGGWNRAAPSRAKSDMGAGKEFGANAIVMESLRTHLEGKKSK